VCAGRGVQAPCRHYQLAASGVHQCNALYNVVTGEALKRFCEDVRGDQDTCGRRGLLYEAVGVRSEGVPTNDPKGFVRYAVDAYGQWYRSDEAGWRTCSPPLGEAVEAAGKFWMKRASGNPREDLG